jgi:hypothetical protein
MAEMPVQFENISYRRLFPWLHLIRAFWIATDIRKLFLAAAALVLVSAGSLFFDRLPFGQPESANDLGRPHGEHWPWELPLGYAPAEGDPSTPIQNLLRSPGGTIVRASDNWQIVLLPFRDLLGRSPVLFRRDATLPQLADAVSRILWNLAVWSIFGGAICRIAAVQFARDHQIGLRQALAFSVSKFFGYFSAPLLPLVGVGLLWVLCVIGGWIGRIPGGVGPGILGVLWPLELIFGFMMTVVLFGATAGWPLMFATISVEGTDGFDGLSRAYNYVFERPLYALWQAVVVMAYGSIAIFLVWTLSQVLTQLSLWGVSWGMGQSGAESLIAGAPEIVAGGRISVQASASLGNSIAIYWMRMLAVAVVGFVYTFFWSSATIAYFVLRHSIDANNFDEVYVEDVEEKDDLLPLVGTAAMGASGAPAVPPEAPMAPTSEKPVDLTP